MASFSLKCDQDWMRDEEVENREQVTITYLFGLLDLVCFDAETACRSNFIMMKLHI